jgi:DNA-binding GntR family transcriptional regulator
MNEQRSFPRQQIGQAPEAPVTLVARASSELREEILSGRLASGERINLRHAAERLGSSQIPVREALRSLAVEGLVTSLPQRGYRVAPISVDDLRDLYGLRIVLDGLATLRAAPNLTAEQIEDAKMAVERWAGAIRKGDPMAARHWHRRIHFGVYEACGSPWLLRFVDMLWAHSERYQRLSADVRGDVDAREAEHREFISACATGDGAVARRRLVQHLERTAESVERLLVESVAEPGPAVGRHSEGASNGSILRSGRARKTNRKGGEPVREQ